MRGREGERERKKEREVKNWESVTIKRAKLNSEKICWERSDIIRTSSEVGRNKAEGRRKRKR